jgi:hypothetical protein
LDQAGAGPRSRRILFERRNAIGFEFEGLRLERGLLLDLVVDIRVVANTLEEEPRRPPLPRVLRVK